MIWVVLGVFAVLAVVVLVLWLFKGREDPELARAKNVKRDEADKRYGDSGLRGMGQWGP